MGDTSLGYCVVLNYREGLTRIELARSPQVPLNALPCEHLHLSYVLESLWQSS
jgi:hypothetical protein